MYFRKLIALLFLSVVYLSCEEEERGACESEIVNFQGFTLFICEEDEESELCEGSKDHFWKDKTCANLGYPYYNDTNKSWQAGSANNTIPGAYGYWGDQSASGSDGGGGTGSCDASGYQGPEFDIQVDSQCKAAYAYQCAGNTQGIAATCAIYNQFKADNPSIPDCPYCS
ncbi:MAG: hypothetical protein AB7O48_13095 [Cyclobacteriaceae bacterium]